MGIPTNRFIDRLHEQFVCTICLDVSTNPVVMNDCDHIFCLGCVITNNSTTCPTCRVELKTPPWKEMTGSIKRVYLDLVIKCLNPRCMQRLKVDTFQDHDKNCPTSFNICKDCGYKTAKDKSTHHSCVQQLKTKLEESHEANAILAAKMAGIEVKVSILMSERIGTIKYQKDDGDNMYRVAHTLERIKAVEEDSSTSLPVKFIRPNIRCSEDARAICSCGAVLCTDCFTGGAHKEHKQRIPIGQSMSDKIIGCSCGDPYMAQPDNFCRKHQLKYAMAKKDLIDGKGWPGTNSSVNSLLMSMLLQKMMNDSDSD